MSFLIHSVDGGHIIPWDYKPAAAITPKVGLALTPSSGNLAVASGTTKPVYIGMAEHSAAVTAGTIIPVVRVTEDIIFETTFSASATDRKIGDKVTIASDGLRVTATTSSGVAEIVGMDGTAEGDKVRVRFP